MNVLFFLSGPGAIYPNLKVLFFTLLKLFPEDTYYAVCLAPSEISSWHGPKNLQIITVEQGCCREWARFRLCSHGLGRLAKEKKIDVIWSINIGPYRHVKTPNVLFLQNAYQVYPPSVMRYHFHNRLQVTALRYFFRKSLRHSDGVMVETPLMAQYVRAMRSAPRRVTAISKAVESEDDIAIQPLPDQILQQLDGGLGCNVFSFFYAASSYPHKNHATLIGAMEVLRRQGVRARIVLTISVDELFALGGEKARSLVESGHLLPIGRIGKEHLRPLYDMCGGCVMPSVLESQSSSHLEAMIWKKPQISADLPYARELCGGASLYAEPKNPDDWAAKMQMLMESSEHRERLVAAGLEQMETFPKTWREVARQVRSFLAEVAGKK